MNTAAGGASTDGTRPKHCSKCKQPVNGHVGPWDRDVDQNEDDKVDKEAEDWIDLTKQVTHTDPPTTSTHADPATTLLQQLVVQMTQFVMNLKRPDRYSGGAETSRWR